mgnify:CR=1 FL=1
MRALTVRQPWAEAIACGAKLVENRSMGTRYRGPLAVHAGKGWAEWGFADERLRELWPDGGPMPWQRSLGYALRHVPAYHGRPPHPFLSGRVLAVAELVDVHEAVPTESGEGCCCEPWGELRYAASDGRVRTGVRHWLLEDVVRLPSPVEARGRLGLWTPNPELTVLLQLGRLEGSLAAAGAARAEAHR